MFAHPGLVRWGRRLLVGCVLIGLLLVGGTAFRVWYVARADERPPVDAIVVLGAAQYNGTPSKIFQARLRHASLLYDEGVADQLVTTGSGQDEDTFTEAEAGAQWLVEHGVPAGNIVAAGKGSNTLRSVHAVADEAEEHGWREVVLVSDPWHVLRARVMAEDAGLEAWSSPTHNGPIVQERETQMRYVLRETSGLLHYRLTRSSA